MIILSLLRAIFLDKQGARKVTLSEKSLVLKWIVNVNAKAPSAQRFLRNMHRRRKFAYLGGEERTASPRYRLFFHGTLIIVWPLTRLLRQTSFALDSILIDCTNLCVTNISIFTHNQLYTSHNIYWNLLCRNSSWKFLNFLPFLFIQNCK